MLNTGCSNNFQIFSEDFLLLILPLENACIKKIHTLNLFHSPSLSGSIIFTCQNLVSDPLSFPHQHFGVLAFCNCFPCISLQSQSHFSSPSFQFVVCPNETILFIVALNIQLQSCSFSKTFIF